MAKSPEKKAAKKAAKKARRAEAIAEVGAIVKGGKVNAMEILKEGATAFVYGMVQERSTLMKLAPKVTDKNFNEDLVVGGLAVAGAIYGPKMLKPTLIRTAGVAVTAIGFKAGAASKAGDKLLASLDESLQVKGKDGVLLQPNAVSTNPSVLTVVPK